MKGVPWGIKVIVEINFPSVFGVEVPMLGSLICECLHLSQSQTEASGSFWDVKMK